MYGNPQQQPRAKGMGGCAIAALVGVVLVCIAGGACVVCVAIGSRSSARAKPSMAGAKDVDSPNRAALRKACDAGPNDVLSDLDDASFTKQCHDDLRSLVFPDQLTFANVPDTIIDEGCAKSLTTVVARKHADGHVSKPLVMCVHDPRTGSIRATFATN